MVYKIHIWRLVLVPLALCVAAFTADLRGQDTISYYRFEEGGGIDVIDDETDDFHGLVQGGAVFSPDAPRILGGPDNDFSMDFRGVGSLQMDGVPFLFHHADVGGVDGDATLEFFLKPSSGPGGSAPRHSALFWTCNCNPLNLIHVYWGTGGCDDCVVGDWHSPVSGNNGIAVLSSGVHLELDVWHSVLIHRIDLGGVDEWRWEWWIDGVLNEPQTVETFVRLPDDQGGIWTVNGRPGNFNFNGLMDEIRLTEGFPDELLLVDAAGCPSDDDPENGDTHCLGLTVEAVEGAGNQYTATVEASDDTGDGILYTIIADNGAGLSFEEKPIDGVESFFLTTDGTWTFTASVDDDIPCLDAAADMSCDPVEVVVVIPPPEVARAWYRFEEGSGIDVIDDETGDSHGTVEGLAAFSPDAAPLVGLSNDVSMDFTESGSVNIDVVPFVFHHPSSGGALGDATLEFLVKPSGPPTPSHSALFWTCTCNPLNLVHIYWGTGAGAQYIIGDFHQPANGGSTNIANLSGGVSVELGRWTHVAIVRTALGGANEWRWEWYFNGELNAPETAETARILPTPESALWTINGRGGFSFSGLMDEIRLTFDRALTPDEFITIGESVCPTDGDPEDGDTHCLSLTVDPATGPTGTTFTATVEASDDTGDPISYTITADCPDCDDGAGETVEQTTTAGEASFFVASPGTWTFTASVDDTPDCDDAAANRTCASVDVEVTGERIVTRAWYRFEEGVGTDVVDDLSGDPHGIIDTAVFSPDTAPLAGGLSNDASLDFTQGGDATIDGTGFVFHDAVVGGAPGDATLEFLVKPVSDEFGNPPTHSALFWTCVCSPTNLVHIYWSTGGCVPCVVGDWHQPANGPVTNIAVLAASVPLELDQWHHVAIVRTALGVDQWRWEWYFDGVLNEPQTVETFDRVLPDNPGAWTINGRPGFHFRGLMDEIRMSFEALEPEDFIAIADTACPDDGDTHCLSLTVDGPPENVPGTYTATVEASDESGDGISYTITADCPGCNGGGGQTIEETPASGAADFVLAAGTWTFTASVDDDPACGDAAPDRTCDSLEVVVTETVDGVGPFLRGDCDGNGSVGGSPTEAIIGLNFSFRGGPAPPCLAACDAEANGTLGITDYLRILRHSFLGQGEPDPPFPDCVKSNLASDVELGCDELPIVCK